MHPAKHPRYSLTKPCANPRARHRTNDPSIAPSILRPRRLSSETVEPPAETTSTTCHHHTQLPRSTLPSPTTTNHQPPPSTSTPYTQARTRPPIYPPTTASPIRPSSPSNYLASATRPVATGGTHRACCCCLRTHATTSSLTPSTRKNRQNGCCYDQVSVVPSQLRGARSAQPRAGRAMSRESCPRERSCLRQSDLTRSDLIGMYLVQWLTHVFCLGVWLSATERWERRAC